MKPPEKIYLQVDENGHRFETNYEGVTWCQDRINDTDIKYIRADLAACYPTSGINSDRANCAACKTYHDQKKYCRKCGTT